MCVLEVSGCDLAGSGAQKLCRVLGRMKLPTLGPLCGGYQHLLIVQLFTALLVWMLIKGEPNVSGGFKEVLMNITKFWGQI